MTRPAEQDQAGLAAKRESYDMQLRTAGDALVAAIRVGVTDGAETISHLLATAAANLGGMHTLTAARPGSWEASYVDQFLASTVGADGEYLLQYRTAPIEVVECVETLLAELDIDGLYDDSFNLIDQAEAAVADAVNNNGDEAGPDAAYERLAETEKLIEQLRNTDYAAYRSVFETQVAAAADELRRHRGLPATVPVTVLWVAWTDRTRIITGGDVNQLGTVEFELWETARLRTPPPGFTEPLEELAGPQTPGQLLRSAGRMPHQRIGRRTRSAAP